MDADDAFSGRPDDPIRLLQMQDLDPLSVDELKARIDALQAEITRAEGRLSRAASDRSSAEALFKR